MSNTQPARLQHRRLTTAELAADVLLFKEIGCETDGDENVRLGDGATAGGSHYLLAIPQAGLAEGDTFQWRDGTLVRIPRQASIPITAENYEPQSPANPTALTFTAVGAVDGTGNNAASNTDVDAHFASLQAYLSELHTLLNYLINVQFSNHIPLTNTTLGHLKELRDRLKVTGGAGLLQDE